MIITTLNFIIFLLAVIFCFTIPGLVLCKRTESKLTVWGYLFIATVVGFTAFTLLSYILLHFKLIILLLPILLLINLAGLRLVYDLRSKIQLAWDRGLVIVLAIMTIGIIGQLLIIAPSGKLSDGDLVFWSSHGHDGTWHLALMEEIKKGLPLQNPVFAGEKLANYHFFSDIAPALFNLFLKIPTLDLYFRFFPLLFSILLGYFAFYLGRILGGNTSCGIWAMVMTYFSGSFGYVVTFIKNGQIGGESLFWGSQIQSSSGNPPLMASLVILLALLIFLKIFYESSKTNLSIFLLSVVLLGSLIEFKSYAGLVILLSIGIVGIWQAVKDRRIQIFLLFILGSFLCFILYFPNSSGATGFLIFEPWWFIRTMIVAPDRLNWIDLELKRQTYIAEGNFKRVLQIEITGFLIFLFGNLGMKFVGFWQFIKFIRSSLNNYFYLNLIIICVISFILPLLFLQKGVAGNTIQFLQYFLLVFGILAGITISHLLQLLHSKLLIIILAIIIIILAIPTQASLIINFYSHRPLAKIDKEELIALKFLSQETNPSSIILTPPFSKGLNLNMPTPPIWSWSDTAYVSALSARRTYLADTEQVDIMGYDLKERLLVQQDIFSESNSQIFEKKLKANKIDYLYFPKFLKPAIDPDQTNLKKVFSNSLVEIWKI